MNPKMQEGMIMRRDVRWSDGSYDDTSVEERFDMVEESSSVSDISDKSKRELHGELAQMETSIFIKQEDQRAISIKEECNSLEYDNMYISCSKRYKNTELTCVTFLNNGSRNLQRKPQGSFLTSNQSKSIFTDNNGLFSNDRNQTGAFYRQDTLLSITSRKVLSGRHANRYLPKVIHKKTLPRKVSRTIYHEDPYLNAYRLKLNWGQRERQKKMRLAFLALMEVLPRQGMERKKHNSKLEILQKTIQYIKYLQNLLSGKNDI